MMTMKFSLISLVGIATISSASAFLTIQFLAKHGITESKLFYNNESYLQQLETRNSVEAKAIAVEGTGSYDSLFERESYNMIQACSEAEKKLDVFGEQVHHIKEEHREEIAAMEQKMRTQQKLMQQKINQLEFDLRNTKLNAQREKMAAIQACKDHEKDLQNELNILRQKIKKKDMENKPVEDAKISAWPPELNNVQRVETSSAARILAETRMEKANEQQHKDIQKCFWSNPDSVNPNQLVITYVGN
mmetsp:Transcript_26407/g.39034  ORF Transcript_26407/g.39034 Transcript_26407/m.39034 type:complete len:247 (+) Transcript_26407:31-771(+)